MDVEKGKENEENAAPRRSARIANTEPSTEVGNPEKFFKKELLPFARYSGDIKYYTEGNEIAEASDSLMKFVDKQTNATIVPLSFDMEWPFSFHIGPGKSATIQICIVEDCCYVFHLTNLKKLPAALIALLKHPKVRPHGVNIKNDFRKLARDFPELDAQPIIDKCIDLGVFCNQVCETGGRWSLDRLANYTIKLAVNKDKRVRMSKWHIVPLAQHQLIYASIDVYVGQLIYRELQRRAIQKQKNEALYKEQNGETAFKAVKALGVTFLDESTIPSK